MTLREWMDAKKIDPASGICVTIGTDGLKPGRDKLMSIGIASLIETSLDREYARQFLYVEGADVMKTAEYTGLTKEEYDANACGLPYIKERLDEILPDPFFMVCYTPDFLLGFLPPELNKLKMAQYLDVPQYIRFRDRGGSIPDFIDTVEKLNGYCKFELTGSKMSRGEYSIETLQARCGLIPCDEIVLKRRLMYTARVYEYALDL